MTIFAKLHRDEAGASAAEYALLLAVIGTALAVAAIYLGEVIGTAISAAAECIETDGGTCPH